MRSARLRKLMLLTVAARIALAAPSLHIAHAAAAEEEAGSLVTQEMREQLRPEVRGPLEEAALYTAVGRPDSALALLEPLAGLLADGALNYWETFDYHFVLGETRLKMQSLDEARTAFEECMKFSDIDSDRRYQLLRSLARVYVLQKEAERAIGVYQEINSLRGGRDPQTTVLIAQIHERILGDRATALLYLEDAVRYDGDRPDRSRLQLLRRAYVYAEEYEKALEVARALVEYFDEPDDLESLENILDALNRRK